MIQDLKIKKIELQNPENIRIAIIQSQYHQELNHNMTTAALQVLDANNISPENISIIEAPGAWEVPLLADIALLDHEAVIAFGIIIKGDTYHFESIANETSRALMNISLSHSKPVGFEILAVYQESQAIERASLNKHNKGIEAANAVLKVLEAKQNINSNKK